MSQFAARRILITGSSRGIGHRAAVKFLELSGSLIIHGRRTEGVERAVSTLAQQYPDRVTGIAADLADRKAQDHLASVAGEIDVLVNCAGIFRDQLLEDAGESDWRDTMEINVTAPWRLSRGLLPVLRQRKGVIVNISSDAALLGYAGSTAYCASKGALAGLTRALATELAPDVRVLCVCPGPVDTDMMRESVEALPDPIAARRQWESYPLLRRIAGPDEIAEAIVFAASPVCTFQTGSLIMIDGGATAGRRP
jgi:meso-butanediol dehydrogenase / (S,S)-butanediol dehydrogenase / diacetyl reductase